MSGRISLFVKRPEWKVLGERRSRLRDPGWVYARSGGGPRILAARDALASEETVDDTVRASAAIGLGGFLLRHQGGAVRGAQQSPKVAVLRTSPDPGDRLPGAVVFEHLVDRVQRIIVV